MSDKKKKEEVVTEPIIDEPIIEEKPVETPKKKVDVDRFIARQLQVINEMPNKAKAKYLASRVLRNKK